MRSQKLLKDKSEYCTRTSPPAIAANERELPRQTRVVFAQLRSGWCRRLNSYWARINSDVQNICPACGTDPHDTLHLFCCPAKPTHLTPVSLWTQPIQVASFLRLDLEAEPDWTESEMETERTQMCELLQQQQHKKCFFLNIFWFLYIFIIKFIIYNHN